MIDYTSQYLTSRVRLRSKILKENQYRCGLCHSINGKRVMRDHSGNEIPADDWLRKNASLKGLVEKTFHLRIFQLNDNPWQLRTVTWWCLCPKCYAIYHNHVRPYFPKEMYGSDALDWKKCEDIDPSGRLVEFMSWQASSLYSSAEQILDSKYRNSGIQYGLYGRFLEDEHIKPLIAAIANYVTLTPEIGYPYLPFSRKDVTNEMYASQVSAQKPTKKVLLSREKVIAEIIEKNKHNSSTEDPGVSPEKN